MHFNFRRMTDQSKNTRPRIQTRQTAYVDGIFTDVSGVLCLLLELFERFGWNIVVNEVNGGACEPECPKGETKSANLNAHSQPEMLNVIYAISYMCLDRH